MRPPHLDAHQRAAMPASGWPGGSELPGESALDHSLTPPLAPGNATVFISSASPVSDWEPRIGCFPGYGLYLRLFVVFSFLKHQMIWLCLFICFCIKATCILCRHFDQFRKLELKPYYYFSVKHINISARFLLTFPLCFPA